jgi:hypothetical protein
MLKRMLAPVLMYCVIFLLNSCNTKENPETASATPRLYPMKENAKWGYMDETGKVVITPAYDYTWDFTEGLGRIKTQGKYGFVNEKGEMIIPPSFAFADDFKDGYARVNTSDVTTTTVLYDGYDLSSGWTFVNPQGVVFSQTFAKAEWLRDGIAQVKDDAEYETPWTYVSISDGNLIASERPTEAIFTYNGHNLAPASDPSTGKIGMIDKMEQWVIQPTFDAMEPFSEGLAAAKKDNLFGYVDLQGNWVYQEIVPIENYFSLSYDFKPFSNGLAAVRITKDSYTYINHQGKQPFKQRFTSAASFTEEGYAIVATEAGTGLIDTKGTFVIKPHLEISSVEKGIVIYHTNEGYGAKDLKTLKDIVPPKYGDVELAGDLIRLRESGATTGYINQKGEFVIAPEYAAAWSFIDGKGIVNIKDKML